MRMGPIFLLAGTVAFVGWIAPGLKAGGSDHAKVATRHDDSSAKKAWLAGETVLSRAPDGHFYADADVEQRRTHFLVDTGATIVALTGNDARAIGLDWNDSDLMPIGRGANGTVYGVPVSIGRMELGGLEAHDVQAAIVPSGLDVSLLGQSFLSHVGNVRIEGEHMTLGASGG
ncbi:aspartyl protease family protein [Novosphingobium sp. PhB165]|uniref:retropepsin-like aspartic protease family protein n=1 Tax=Novosphingobium sp. PhB165 TaxID=2485105 RepID=UPI00104355F4|nr:TIGR02281 family clan AA aspartic protease [Novosphingobium sp. PhB165]TCM18811.1 aspartyl protease family protein [Novosphingobium sp. PhB165]